MTLLLGESAPTSSLEGRIATLSGALLRLVFGHVSRSIFNTDRLTFGRHQWIALATSSNAC
jgi:dynein heavy chain 2